MRRSPRPLAETRTIPPPVRGCTANSPFAPLNAANADGANHNPITTVTTPMNAREHRISLATTTPQPHSCGYAPHRPIRRTSASKLHHGLPMLMLKPSTWNQSPPSREVNTLRPARLTSPTIEEEESPVSERSGMFPEVRAHCELRCGLRRLPARTHRWTVRIILGLCGPGPDVALAWLSVIVRVDGSRSRAVPPLAMSSPS
jgi:hypothetical protein